MLLLKTSLAAEKLLEMYASDKQAKESAEKSLQATQAKIKGMQDKLARLKVKLEQASGQEPVAKDSQAPRRAYRVLSLLTLSVGISTWDYEASNDVELTFHKGDVLTISDENDVYVYIYFFFTDSGMDMVYNTKWSTRVGGRKICATL